MKHIIKNFKLYEKYSLAPSRQPLGKPGPLAPLEFLSHKNRQIKHWRRGAAIVQWIHLRLPSCCPGFESLANHLSFYFKYSQICAIIVNVL